MNSILPNRSNGDGRVFTDDPEDGSPSTSVNSSRITMAGARSESRRNNNKSGYRIPEFDKQGDELGKEARVWKVYVNETDKWDADLVNRWDRSLDVILVFAALFSAISTAFLIESSNRLRKDPADVSADSLLIIARTVLAMANNTRPPDLDLSPNADRTPYQPSHAAVVINALWYLSLSLSVVTSLLAMLAKEWCQSFMSGRMGHPFTQARRRQQKWNRIEYWRMREVLAALPSLMHLALSLFAIGLCIDVWETNASVASPVVAITLIAGAFYVWSSLMGVWIDNFPYTTAISRTFRSKKMLSMIHQALKRVAVPLAKKIRSFVRKRYLGNNWPCFLDTPLKYLNRMFHQLTLNLDGYLETALSNDLQKENPGQDEITSLALGWLIRYCEVPCSVDVALQAIAGASARLPRRPLELCNAAVLISRRLASDRLHKEIKSDTRDKTTSLYLQALSFLNPKPSPDLPKTGSSENLEELEGLVLDLQFESERRVAAALVTSSTFIPNKHNLAALRTGSLAATQSLTLLRGDRSQDSHNSVIQPILQLLQQHNQGINRLHPAACLSLINAAILFSACSIEGRAARGLASICLKILYDDNLGWSLDLKLAVPLIVCALMQRKKASGEKLGKGWHNSHFRPLFQILLDQPSSTRQYLGQLVWSGAITVLSHPSQYQIDVQDLESSQLLGMLERAKFGASGMWERLRPPPPNDRIETLQHPTALTVEQRNRRPPIGMLSIMIISRIQASRRLFDILQDGASGWEGYMFATTSILRLKPLSMDPRCWSILSQMSFPRLSKGFTKFLEHREIIQTIKDCLDDGCPTTQFVATAQLWLLCAIALDPPTDVISDPDDRSETQELLALLRQGASLNDEQAVHNTKASLGQKIEELCKNARWIKDHNSIYVYRVLECVLQSKNGPSSGLRGDHIQHKLAKVPQSLRGLASFTGFYMRAPEANNRLEKISSDAHLAILVEDLLEKR